MLPYSTYYVNFVGGKILYELICSQEFPNGVVVGQLMPNTISIDMRIKNLSEMTMPFAMHRQHIGAQTV